MLKHCEWCDDNFETDSKNQIYCDSDCRTLATKQKIVQRYKFTKVKDRMGKERKCHGDCGTYLSIYNDNLFCDTCLINNKKVDKTLKEIKGYYKNDKG